MKKGIMACVVTLLLPGMGLGDSLWAGGGSRAGDRNNEPANTQFWENFKDLMAEAEDILSVEEQNELDSNESIFYDYNYNVYPHHTWDWLVVVFRIDSLPDTEFTVRWESYTDNNDDYGVEIYIWDPRDYSEGGERFVLKDTGPIGSPPWSSPRSFDITPSRWFHYDSEEETWKCWLLLEGITESGQRDMHSDVCRIDY
jgi:hypothetical protein